MKKLTRERVVPTISASVSCDTLGTDSLTFLATPAESRKSWRSKPRFFLSIILDFTLLELAIALIRTSLDHLHLPVFMKGGRESVLPVTEGRDSKHNSDSNCMAPVSGMEDNF
jgi:hypothetical protein